MPTPINRVPPGLLSLLDVKSMGANPVQLGDELQGVFQLTELYVNSIAQSRTGFTAPVAIVGAFLASSGFLFQAQPGEILVIEKAGIMSNTPLGAGQSYRIRPCVTGSGGSIVWIGPSSGTSAPGEICATYADRPLVLMPGHSLALLTESVTAGATQFQIGGNVASLRF